MPNKSGDPVILDPRDAMAVSKCQVKMQPPKGVPTTRETWRPLWKNHSNPFQFDRQYLQAIELARLRTMEKQQDRRLKALTGPSPSLAVGFTHTADLFNPEDGNRYHNPLSRSASSPAMATFQRHTNALSNCTAVLTGGRGFEKNCYDQGTQPLRGTHLPGYQGYVPGFSTNNLSLGKCFSPATTVP
ncbi:unnamed protein product [Durusdinium trenchii]|uniref:Uncharacterized protein n=1 Tax=Durusdinium trenchii TaxID=1381693 RepID=A0ABP0T2Q9_9DINO